MKGYADTLHVRERSRTVNVVQLCRSNGVDVRPRIEPASVTKSLRTERATYPRVVATERREPVRSKYVEEDRDDREPAVLVTDLLLRERDDLLRVDSSRRTTSNKETDRRYRLVVTYPSRLRLYDVRNSVTNLRDDGDVIELTTALPAKSLSESNRSSHYSV